MNPELTDILEALHYRLLTFNGQQLAEAGLGEVLTEQNSFTLDLAPELAMVQRALDIVKEM